MNKVIPEIIPKAIQEISPAFLNSKKNPFPYMLGNTQKITSNITLAGKEIIQGIKRGAHEKYLCDFIAQKYANLLQILSIDDYETLREITEFRLSRLFWIAWQERKKINQKLELINPNSEISVNLLTGKYIIGGYINRSEEKKAELFKARKRLNFTGDLTEYKSERNDRVNQNKNFILNFTAEIETNRKLILQDSAMNRLKNDDATKNLKEIHYITIESILFDTNSLSLNNSPIDIHKLDRITNGIIVDFDYALKGNFHYREKPKNQQKSKNKK